MRKECVICSRLSEQKEEGFCSKECYEKHCKNMMKYNVKGSLGLGFCWEKRCNLHELIEIQYTIINLETGKTDTHTINFEEDL